MSARDYYGNNYAAQQQAYPQQAQYAPQQPTYDNRGTSPYPQQYQQQPQYGAGAQGQFGPDGEKGLGATLVGGGAGGWVTRKAGGGFFGSLAGAAAGALGANVLESKLKKHKKNKKDH
ncbi:hypothetical protein EDB81DRAFT_942396 [Dactylonectria macrodidyma]|uniref:Glycine zipper 2TM domain-containing protein n=1 Tax=Dactylonectria macrodidyma TaxID=307937 RepID=A0A9P9FML4_9HYPO|nr:hypothetical protein EDB81DRAFT_942396 [Dactylonectria macrodidyma]